MRNRCGTMSEFDILLNLLDDFFRFSLCLQPFCDNTWVCRGYIGVSIEPFTAKYKLIYQIQSATSKVIAGRAQKRINFGHSKYF